MLDIGELESLSNQQKVLLIAGMQSYRNSVLGNPLRSGFPSGVNCLSNLRPMGEVSPYNHIVNEVGIGVAIAGLPIVNDSSACPLHNASLQPMQVPL